VALGEGEGVGGGGWVGVGVGVFVADAVGFAFVGVGLGGRAFLVGAWVGRAWVVARVLAVEAALGDWVGFCSGRTVLAGAPVLSGLLLGVGSPLTGGCVGSGDAEEGSGEADVGDATAAADAAAVPDPIATATTPVATTATAVVPAVRASTSRTARSRRRPEG
jgi:hypothetical protein